MERHLRARHARLWIILGPALLALVVALLIRPHVEEARAAQPPISATGTTP